MLNGFKSPQRIALVGGSSEIGAEIVRHLPADNLQEIVVLNRATTGFDARNAQNRRDGVAELFANGDIDIAVIAIGVLGDSLAMSAEENLLDVTDVNYTGTLHLIHLISEKMKVQGHGKILVISSFAQVRPRIDNFTYGSSKAGLDFYARGLAASLKGTGVSISVLRPGFVHTRMTKGMKVAPFSITAEVAGEAGANLLKGGSRIAFVPGILKYVAWVFRLIPAFIFNKLG